MHPAYSVIVFTTASGAGYGLLAWLGLVGMVHGPASTFRFGATALVVALGLITTGLLSSTFHLGHPERAWRAFTQWRSSWLSREGVAAVIAYLPALVFAWYWLKSPLPSDTLAFAGLAMAATALVTVFCTAMIYASLPTIRQWRHRLVVPVYLVFALATGAGLLLAIAHLFGRGQPVQATICVITFAVAGVLKIVYWTSIDRQTPAHTIEEATGLGHLGSVRQLEMPHTSENFVMREMGYRVARRHARKLRAIVIAALTLAAAASALTLAAPGLIATALAVLAAIAGLFAALVERWLFFAEAKHVAMLYYGAREV